MGVPQDPRAAALQQMAQQGPPQGPPGAGPGGPPPGLGPGGPPPGGPPPGPGGPGGSEQFADMIGQGITGLLQSGNPADIQLAKAILGQAIQMVQQAEQGVGAPPPPPGPAGPPGLGGPPGPGGPPGAPPPFAP
jgi:hypothetical protein